MDNLPDTGGNPFSADGQQSQNQDPNLQVPKENQDLNMENEEDKKVEEPKEKDPNDIIPRINALNALNIATDDIAQTLNTTFRKPPSCVAVLIKKDNTNLPDVDSADAEVAVTDFLDRIFTVYEFFLKDRTNVYAIITADRYTKDYKNFEWNNEKYHGFYSTRQEAINYIKGHLR